MANIGAKVSACMPFLLMVFVQVCYAGMNISSKVALESGMNPLVLVVYRQIFATLSIAPFSVLIERKLWSKITPRILFRIFLCSLTGALANQLFYFVGLKYSSAIVTSALSNILPAVTFILAVISRQESVNIKKDGIAKILGTVFCVGGAMLLSFYQGQSIGLKELNINWSYILEAKQNIASNSAHGNSLLGPFFIIVSTIGWAIWFILQAGMSEKFPAPYTSTTLMCLMASVECGAISLAIEHNMSAWSLSDNVKLVAALYAGVMGSAVAFFLTSWSIQRKGPLYASVFSPLLLIVVAILSWALLSEKIYVGTVLGSMLIISGLYSVLWAKNIEMKEQRQQQQHCYKEDQIVIGDETKLDEDEIAEIELEAQTKPKQGGNLM